MLVACVHIPRFAIEVERQRRNDVATRLILIGDATVFDCSLGAEASGVRRGRRRAEPLADELIAALHRRLGFMAAVGTAGGKFTARVAAQTTRPGLAKIVPLNEEASFLVPLSVDLLPASDAMRWRLGLLGLHTMGDVARLPLGAFQSQFGPEGRRCWGLARGVDNEPLAPRVKEETVVRRLQLAARAVTLEAILVGVERLVCGASAGPR